MSVGLFVAYPEPQHEDRFVPVASDLVYSRHWRPVALLLKLRWIPRFQTGWMVTPDDVQPLLRELSQFRRHIVDLRYEPEVAPHLIARASRLSRELSEVLNTPGASAFLGPAGLPLLRRSAPLPLLTWTSSITTLPEPNYFR